MKNQYGFVPPKQPKYTPPSYGSNMNNITPNPAFQPKNFFSLGEQNIPQRKQSGLGRTEFLTEEEVEPVENNITKPIDDINASKIKAAEGNDYSAFGDIGDGAGNSIGAYQFTEKSGMAQKLAKDLGFNTIHDKGFKETLSTPKGIAAQDNLYETYTRRPIELAQKYGVKDNNIIGFMIDTNVNGGLGSVAESALAKGGLTLENLKQARRERYQDIVRRNPAKYNKFLKGWNRRIDKW